MTITLFFTMIATWCQGLENHTVKITQCQNKIIVCMEDKNLNEENYYKCLPGIKSSKKKGKNK